MTDRPSGDPAEREATSGDAADPPVIAGSDEAAQKVQRRAFLRQLTGDAVVATGRLAGLSTALRRTVVAAGVAAVGEPDAPSAAEPASSPAAPQPIVEPPAAEPPAVPAVPTATPTPALDPPSQLTAQQNELLSHGTTAILGVNDASGAPHLTSSIFDWDGTVLRLPSQLFAARVARIDVDPQVSALVELGDEAWVAVTGVADDRLRSGRRGGDAHDPAQGRMTEEEAARAWSRMSATGDRVVIRIRPTRFVWRLP